MYTAKPWSTRHREGENEIISNGTGGIWQGKTVRYNNIDRVQWYLRRPSTARPRFFPVERRTMLAILPLIVIRPPRCTSTMLPARHDRDHPCMVSVVGGGVAREIAAMTWKVRSIHMNTGRDASIFHL